MEVVGDELHVREPKHEQRESSDADEHEDHDDEARESIGREVSRATRLPPLLWGRFGVHPIRILRGSGTARARLSRRRTRGGPLWTRVNRREPLRTDENR
jgi:hypothetical protein